MLNGELDAAPTLVGFEHTPARAGEPAVDQLAEASIVIYYQNDLHRTTSRNVFTLC